MKKSLLALLMLISYGISAQEPIVPIAEETETPWTFGTKFGLNIASLSGDYEDLDYVKGLDSFIGFNGGGWVNYQINTQLSAQAELLGSLQGGNIQYELSFGGETVRPEAEMRLPYILLPVSLRYAPLPKAYVEFGPQLNILLKEAADVKAIIDGEELDDDANNIIDSRLDDSRRFDVGLNIGAGYNFYQNWTVYTRYTMGLITVDEREEDQRELKNRVFAFGVSYGF